MAFLNPGCNYEAAMLLCINPMIGLIWISLTIEVHVCYVVGTGLLWIWKGN